MGKKFDAAQKHFEGKIHALNQDNKRLINIILDSKAENNELIKRVYTLESENSKLNDWVERLLEYTHLTREDMNRITRRNDQMMSMTHTFDAMFRSGIMYGVDLSTEPSFTLMPKNCGRKVVEESIADFIKSRNPFEEIIKDETLYKIKSRQSGKSF